MGIFRKDKSEDLLTQEPSQLLPMTKPSADSNTGPIASLSGPPTVSRQPQPHPQAGLPAPFPLPIAAVPAQPPVQQPPHHETRASHANGHAVAAHAQAHPTKANTAFLDHGTKIKGNLQFDCPVQIDGQIEGEIVGKEHVTIGESANVVAAIRATSVIIDGRVNGDVTASDRIELRPHARVLGNLTAPKIVIQEGAQYEGRCAMKAQPAVVQAESSKSSHLVVVPVPAPAPAQDTEKVA